MSRPVIRFGVPSRRGRERPVIEFASGPESDAESGSGSGSGGRPVVELDTDPDTSREARIARIERDRARWAQIVDSRRKK